MLSHSVKGAALSRVTGADILAGDLGLRCSSRTSTGGAVANLAAAPPS